ncbi:hypothetical protein D3C81_1135750 [compost metagenome]
MRASSTLIATRSIDNSVRPPAWPTAIATSGFTDASCADIASMAAPNTHGSWRATMTASPTCWPSSARTASHEGLTGSLSNGSKPVSSTVRVRMMRVSMGYIRKYSRTILAARMASADGTCARMTAFLSSSSSSAAGTMLKLAAIGVISVPQ